ncbi:hypothetical protein LshimejAT787_0600540 [Lyophyllum shimeji]|uniref:Uncharacterized protein n=1 Tax=Lyophyllum shimeji TaxID=47721 RepID=A0A9P3UN22_LYOSH|nr:hypothetical protein LshimejAT787_0600540 [Lyophyllum shimeji]
MLCHGDHGHPLSAASDDAMQRFAGGHGPGKDSAYGMYYPQLRALHNNFHPHHPQPLHPPRTRATTPPTLPRRPPATTGTHRGTTATPSTLPTPTFSSAHKFLSGVAHDTAPAARGCVPSIGVGVALPQGGFSLHPPPRGATATATSAASFGLNWPTHVRPPHQSAAPPPLRSSHPQPPSDAPSKSDNASGAGTAVGEDAQQDAGGVGWLDLLSAGTPGTTVPSPRSGSTDTLVSGVGA